VWKSEEYKRKPHGLTAWGDFPPPFFSARFCGFDGLPAAFFFLRRFELAFFES
jgi:hypothetical protein